MKMNEKGLNTIDIHQYIDEIQSSSFISQQLIWNETTKITKDFLIGLSMAAGWVDLFSINDRQHSCAVHDKEEESRKIEQEHISSGTKEIKSNQKVKL